MRRSLKGFRTGARRKQRWRRHAGRNMLCSAGFALLWMHHQIRLASRIPGRVWLRVVKFLKMHLSTFEVLITTFEGICCSGSIILEMQI